MKKERKISGLRSSLGRESFSRGDEYVFFCPKCKHHKAKLSVNVLLDKFNCWVCNYSRKSLLELFSQGSPERGEYAVFRGEAAKEEERKYDVPVLPPEFRTLSRPWKGPFYSAAVSYLNERGVGHDEILLWKLGYCEDGPYKNRIIFPSFDAAGSLNFFVGRSFYPGVVPKYKHGNFDKDVIFNDYMVDWEKPVILTEGPFDALKAGTNAVPLQGLILGEGSKLFSKIVALEARVVLALDDEEAKRQARFAELFFKYGIQCDLVDLNGFKDVGEMSSGQFQEAVERAYKVRSSSDLLRLRVIL